MYVPATHLTYMAICMPAPGWLATGGDASAYRYLLQGIRDFPTAEELAEELKAHGFENVDFERLSFGIVQSLSRVRLPFGLTSLNHR